MNWFLVYVVMHLVDAINDLSIFVAVVLGSIIGLKTIFYSYVYKEIGSDGMKEEDKVVAQKEFKVRSRKQLKTLTVLFAVFILLATLIPSRETVITCIVVPKVLNSEVVTSLPEDFTAIYEIGMDRFIEEITPEVEVTATGVEATI